MYAGKCFQNKHKIRKREYSNYSIEYDCHRTFLGFPQFLSPSSPGIVPLRIIPIMYLNKRTWTNSAAAANIRRTRREDMAKTDGRQLLAEVYINAAPHAIVSVRVFVHGRLFVFPPHRYSIHDNNRHPTCYRAVLSAIPVGTIIFRPPEIARVRAIECYRQTYATCVTRSGQSARMQVVAYLLYSYT